MTEPAKTPGGRLAWTSLLVTASLLSCRALGSEFALFTTPAPEPVPVMTADANADPTPAPEDSPVSEEADLAGNPGAPIRGELSLPTTGSILAGPTRAAIEELVWRAGRPFLPGLPASREQERLRLRDRALAELRDELARGGRNSAALDYLREWLASDETLDEFWMSCCRAAARLARYDLAPLLARHLGGEASGPRTLVVRESLHRLYGRWFATMEDVQPYLLDIGPGPSTQLLLSALSREEDRARSRLLELFKLEPMRAAGHLDDPDPRVRAGAARLLGAAFSRPEADAAVLYDLLLGHLAIEFDPSAFDACLEAVVDPLEHVEPAAPELTRLREVLRGVARQGGDPRLPSVGRALARVPWRYQGDTGLDHVLSAVELLGHILAGMTRAESQRDIGDPDLVAGAFSSLQVLCDRAREKGLGASLRHSSARSAVFAVLQDKGRGDAVRAMAASALGSLALPIDAPLLVRILKQTDSRSVSHALLGATRSLLSAFDSESGGADALLGALAELTGDGDSDLRRRALGILADKSLEPLVRRLDPSYLVEHLAREENPELTSELVRLIRRFGVPEMLPALLALPRFDRLAGADLERTSELRAALEVLAGGRPQETFDAARRLASAQGVENALARGRHALGLVAALEAEQAELLSDPEHREIASWAWRLQDSGVPLEDLAGAGTDFVPRLASLHVPRAHRGEGGEGLLSSARLAHLNALCLAELLRKNVGGSKAGVELAFQSALELTREGEYARRLRRDRARFRAAIGDGQRALEDYRALVALDALEIPDLRTAIQLVQATSTLTPLERNQQVYDLLDRLVRRPSWRSEPGAVRMQDIRELVLAALDGAADLGRLRELDALFADVPAEDSEGPPANDPGSPLWAGLTRQPGFRQELLDLRTRLRLSLRDERVGG